MTHKTDNTLQATTTVMTVRPNTNDVTDFARYETVIREMTPAPSIASPILFHSDQDETMCDANEFSDVEFELGSDAVFEADSEQNVEPIPKRTRSQSKTKEMSTASTVEPTRKQTKVKRGTKKVDPEYEPRLRRRVIHEVHEPIDVDTDDE